MKLKIAIAALSALLVVMVAVLIVLENSDLNGKTVAAPTVSTEAVADETTDGTTEGAAHTTEAAEVTEATEATEDAATEPAETATVPGLEDSIFDNEPEKPTDPTEPKATEPKATEPRETEPSTDPTAKPTDPAGDTPSAGELTEYERFMNMSPAEQQEFIESFPSLDDFFAWFEAAKKAHEEANPPIDVGDGSIDMGDIMGDEG